MAKDRQFYMDLTRKYARANGIPEQLLLSQYNQESRFNPTARSYADARGIAQIVPKWHPDVNPNMKGNQLPGVNPEWDIAYGARLMSGHYKKYGSWERALSAYNSGRPDAYKDPKFAKGQTYNYVKAILAGRDQFAKGNQTFGQEETHLPEVSTTDTDSKRKAAPERELQDVRAGEPGA
jgi:soluble lytic murein transglycosylase-like protein